MENFLPDNPDFLHAVARSCGLGYDSFRKKFAQAMGLSPGRYILTCRMERARELMQLQQLTNKEIAALLGFYDEFHFSKTFTRLTGMTPRQFRKQPAGG